ATGHAGHRALLGPGDHGVQPLPPVPQCAPARSSTSPARVSRRGGGRGHRRTPLACTGAHARAARDQRLAAVLRLLPRAGLRVALAGGTHGGAAVAARVAPRGCSPFMIDRALPAPQTNKEVTHAYPPIPCTAVCAGVRARTCRRSR